jgi:uncharacterized membrane protein YidH (DUF202 family)
MSSDLILNVIGLFLNLIGTIIIGLALGKYLRSVSNSFLALEKSIESIADSLNNPNQSAFLLQGLDRHRLKGQKRGKLFTYIGLMLIIVGFALQFLSTLIQANCLCQK